MISSNIVFASSSSASGIAALGFSLSSFLIQLGSFIIVFLILKKYAFKPIIKIMKEREEVINDGVILGESMKKKNQQLETEIELKMQEVRKESDSIISQAQKQSREIILTAETEAQDKANIILTEAKQKIDQDTSRARTKLKTELIGLVSEATEAIIHEKIDQKKDSQLINDSLNGASK
jgi:F-type H+-transporting ATPase subunit b